jgi:hypothetical protein
MHPKAPAPIVLRVMDDPEKEKAIGRSVVIASTNDPDRADDIVDQSWLLDEYRQNPVVLWAHRYDIAPVGKAVRVEVREGRLEMEIEWDTASEMGATVARQYHEGFMNAVSVGFRPGRVIPRRDHPADHPYYKEAGYGVAYYDNVLLENSAVPVPMNGRALQKREVEEIVAKGLDPRGLEMEPEARKSLEAADLAEAIAPVLREMLAEQVEQLRGVVRESVLAGLRESSADIVAEGLAKAFERQAPATVLKGPDADWWDANVTASENTGASDSDWNTW